MSFAYNKNIFKDSSVNVRGSNFPAPRLLSLGRKTSSIQERFKSSLSALTVLKSGHEASMHFLLKCIALISCQIWQSLSVVLLTYCTISIFSGNLTNRNVFHYELVIFLQSLHGIPCNGIWAAFFVLLLNWLYMLYRVSQKGRLFLKLN